MINILKIYQTYHVNHKTVGHKHCRPGWIQIPCPFCTGNPGYHLGFCYSESSQYKGRYVCYRCGGKGIKKVLIEILKLPAVKVDQIIREHGGSGSHGPSVDEQITIRRKAFKYPARTEDLLPHHARYLERRGFDPDKLVKEWGLLSTGPLAPLVTNKKSLNYSHRIIIPIKWKGKVVSFQGRDITNKHKLKYMACPQVRELIEHKTIFYGKRVQGRRCLLVEGVPDVWRLGRGVWGCFGIKYRLAQIRLLATYKEVFIMFDPEPQATQQAEKIKAELLFRGVQNVWLPGDQGSPLPILETDPGDMSQDDADHLMKSLHLF